MHYFHLSDWRWYIGMQYSLDMKNIPKVPSYSKAPFLANIKSDYSSQTSFISKANKLTRQLI